MSFLFHLSAIVVLPFWAAMILAPRAAWTQRLVASPWIAVPPALCYLAFAMPHARELMAAFGAPSPESLAAVMASPWAASMYWAYAGSFDLFVGRWIFLDAKSRGIAHIWVAPVLVVSVFFGALGYVLYAIIRSVHRSPSANALTD